MRKLIKAYNSGSPLFVAISALALVAETTAAAVVSQSLPSHASSLHSIVVAKAPQVSLEVATHCPSDLETLTLWLLWDLPSYVNRVRQRSRSNNSSIPSNFSPSNMIVAGRPEFEPLPVTRASSQHRAQLFNLQQVFFTTLERSYYRSKSPQIFQSESYHWLFLTQSQLGWQFVMLSSRIGHPRAGHPPLPARDSSYGAIAQAIQLWLRDCRAGAVRSKPVLRNDAVKDELSF